MLLAVLLVVAVVRLKHCIKKQNLGHDGREGGGMGRLELESSSNRSFAAPT